MGDCRFAASRCPAAGICRRPVLLLPLIVGALLIARVLPEDANSPPTHKSDRSPHASIDREAVRWDSIAASPRFKALLRAKRRFIVPAMIVFVTYYFALPILVGFARPLMETRVLGPVNLAYLFALSQFFMAWLIAAFYVRAAGRFDRQADEIIDQETRHSP